MFWQYMFFELKRQCTNKKTIAVTIAFFIGLVSFFAYNAYMHRDVHQRRIESLRATETELSDIAARMRAEQHHEDIAVFTGRTAEETSALLAMINEDVRRVSAQRIHTELDRDDMEPSWERVLDATIAQHERLLANFYTWRVVRAEQLNIPVTDIDFTDPTMEHRYRISYTEASLINTIQLYRYLQNAGIPQVYSPYEPSAFHLLHRIISMLGLFILPLMVVMLSADTFSKEGDGGGYKILLLQPISREKIYLAKLASSFAVCLAAIAIPFTVLFCISGVVFGFGYMGYPVPFAPANIQLAAEYETTAAVLARIAPSKSMPDGFITIAAYLIRVLPFLALYVFFMVGLTVFVSMLAKDSVFALAASIGLVLASLVVMEFVSGVALWNPVIYADINFMITNGYAKLYWYPALWAMMLAFAGIVWFRKKDVIC